MKENMSVKKVSVEYEYDGFKILKDVRLPDLKYLSFFDNGMPQSWVAIAITKVVAERLIKSNFSKREVYNALSLGGSTRYYFDEEPRMEQDNKKSH